MLRNEVSKKLKVLIEKHQNCVSSNRETVSNLRHIFAKYNNISHKQRRGKTLSDDEQKYLEKFKSVLIEITEQIDSYNDMVNELIYFVRTKEEGFVFEEFCLVLEESKLDTLQETSIMKDRLFRNSAQGFIDQFSTQKCKSRIDKIISSLDFREMDIRSFAI